MMHIRISYIPHCDAHTEEEKNVKGQEGSKKEEMKRSLAEPQEKGKEDEKETEVCSYRA